jgi:hypothetical protein
MGLPGLGVHGTLGQARPQAIFACPDLVAPTGKRVPALDRVSFWRTESG